MDKAYAQNFALEWATAWNNHNMDEILAHYADDFEMSSPIITQITDEPSGTLKGKEAVRAYWSKALEKIPDLHFVVLGVYTGVNSVVVSYMGPRGVSAEVFHFGEDGKVSKAFAHYE